MKLSNLFITYKKVSDYLNSNAYKSLTHNQRMNIAIHIDDEWVNDTPHEQYLLFKGIEDMLLNFLYCQ